MHANLDSPFAALLPLNRSGNCDACKKFSQLVGSAGVNMLAVVFNYLVEARVLSKSAVRVDTSLCVSCNARYNECQGCLKSFNRMNSKHRFASPAGLAKAKLAGIVPDGATRCCQKCRMTADRELTRQARASDGRSSASAGKRRKRKRAAAKQGGQQRRRSRKTGREADYAAESLVALQATSAAE